MLLKKLEELKRNKKTSDLYTKPLVLFSDSIDMTDNELYDILPFKTQYTVYSINNFNTTKRYLFSKNEEKIFNLKFKEYLKNLLERMDDVDIEYLLDYHVKTYFIDKFNKNELLFLILPFYKRYELQIMKILSVKTLTVSLIAKKLKEEEFLALFLEYFKFLNLEFVNSFVLKVLDIFLDTNSFLDNFTAISLYENVNIYFNEVLVANTYSKRICDLSNIENNNSDNIINTPNTLDSSNTININLDILDSNNNTNLNTLDSSNTINNTNLNNFENLNEILIKLLNNKLVNSKRLISVIKIENLIFLLESFKPLLLVFKLIDLTNINIIPYLEDNINKNTNNNFELANLILLFTIKEIKNKNLNRKWKLTEKLFSKIKNLVLESSDDDLIFLMNEYVNLLENNENEFFINVEFLNLNNKLKFIDENKLTEIQKNFIFKEPKKFLEENFMNVVNFYNNSVNNKNNSKFRYFNSEIDKIDRKNLGDKIFNFLIEKYNSIINLNTNSNLLDLKVLLENLILSKNFISFLFKYKNFKLTKNLIIELLNNKKKSIKYLKIILDIFENDPYIIFEEGYEIFIKIIFNENLKSKNKEILFLLIKKIILLKNNENVKIEYSDNVKLELSKFLFNNNFEILPLLNEIFNILERNEDDVFMKRIILKYKKICTPHFKIIVKKFKSAEILKYFNLRDIFTSLNNNIDINTLNNTNNIDNTNNNDNYKINLLREKEITKIDFNFLLKKNEFINKI